MDGGKLNISRKARTETVDVDATDIRLFRFKEQLVAVAVTKAVNFVFDARTVARPLSVDSPTEHRTILEAAAQNIVRLDIRARNPANAIITDKFIRRVAPEIICVAPRNSVCQMAVAHVPVFRRRSATPSRARHSDSLSELGSPTRPPMLVSSPVNILDARKVPLVITSERVI